MGRGRVKALSSPKLFESLLDGPDVPQEGSSFTTPSIAV
jgi:hypothetical protein